MAGCEQGETATSEGGTDYTYRSSRTDTVAKFAISSAKVSTFTAKAVPASYSANTIEYTLHSATTTDNEPPIIEYIERFIESPTASLGTSFIPTRPVSRCRR